MRGEERAGGNAEHGEQDGRSAEQRLNAAVKQVSAQAGVKGDDQVENDLRKAMADEGLDPGDTSSLAADIAATRCDDSASEHTH